MADFATEFITKLNGKLTPEQMKVVLNELEIFSDDYNIEKKCRDVAVPDDLLPACYKVYMVSKKIEGMSPQSLITYKCYLEQFLYAVGKPVEKITANDIRLYLYGLVGKNSDHTIDTKRIVINTFLDWCCLEYYIPENPCAKIHAIKYEEKPREPLDGIEMEMVRDACVDLRERAMIEFFYSTGCRVSEMAIRHRETAISSSDPAHHSYKCDRPRHGRDRSAETPRSYADQYHDDLRKSNAGKRKIQPSPIRSLTSLQRAVRKRVQCS